MSEYQPTTTNGNSADTLNDHDQKVADYWRRLREGEDPETFTEDDTVGMSNKASETDDQEKATPESDSSSPSDHEEAVSDNTDSEGIHDEPNGPEETDIQDSNDSQPEPEDDVSSSDNKNYKQMYEELLALYSKEQHKSSSWNGRIKAANKRASDSEEMVKQLQAELSALKQNKATEQPTETTTKTSNVDYSALDEIIKDYEGVDDDVVNTWKTVKEKLTSTKAKPQDVPKPEPKTTTTDITPTTTEDAPVNEYTSNLMAIVRTKHPDVDLLISGGEQSKLATWVNTYPDMFKRPVMAAIYNGGTASDIIALIDLYKQETSKPKTQSAKNLLGPTTKQQLVKPMKNKAVAPKVIDERDPRWQQQYRELWAKEKAKHKRKPLNTFK